MFEKTIGIVAGVALAGFVGYKIIKKKKPEIIDKAKRSVSNLKGKSLDVINDAKRSFRDGYNTARYSSSVSTAKA